MGLEALPKSRLFGRMKSRSRNDREKEIPENLDRQFCALHQNGLSEVNDRLNPQPEHEWNQNREPLSIGQGR